MRHKLETNTFILLTTVGLLVCAAGLALLRASERAREASAAFRAALAVGAAAARRLRGTERDGGLRAVLAWPAARALALGAASVSIVAAIGWRLSAR